MINNDKTCRICLCNKALVDIYKTNRKDSLKTMMNALFAFKVDENDDLPNRLCKKCSSKLTTSYKFKLLAEESHEKLTQCMKDDDKSIIQEVLITDTPEIKVEKKICLWEDTEDNYELSPEDFKDASGEYDESQFSSYSVNHTDGGNNSQQIEIKIDKYEDEDTKVDENHYKKKHCKSKKAGRKLNKQRVKYEDLTEKIKSKNKRDRTPTACDECGKTVVNMKDHKKIHMADRKVFPCESCTKVFMTRKARKIHNNRIHLGMTYFCQICQKFYSVEASEHIRLKHTPREKKYECDHCEWKFYTKGSLVVHMNKHVKRTSHRCEVCGKGFSSTTLVNYHKRSVHDKIKPHICHYCSKGFFDKHSLNVHLRFHTKEGITCPDCGKMFYCRYSMQHHRKLHGEKQFECQICNKRFHTNGNLNIHMVSHTKEKKYPCKYCDVKFGRSDHRNRHQITAHESKIQPPPAIYEYM